MGIFPARIVIRLVIVFFIALYPGLRAGYAQATGDPKEDFLYGEYYLSQDQYEKALPFYLAALEKLDSVKNLGFSDAFIRNILTIQNYQGY